MSFSWWTFALQAVNFLILVWLLRRFLFKPVTAIVARRKEEIARGMAEVSAEKQNALNLQHDLQAQLAWIEAERQKAIEEQRAQLAAESKKMIDEARAEAEKIRDPGGYADRRRNAPAASQEVFSQTVELAVNLAETAASRAGFSFARSCVPDPRAGLSGSSVGAGAGGAGFASGRELGRRHDRSSTRRGRRGGMARTTRTSELAPKRISSSAPIRRSSRARKSNSRAQYYASTGATRSRRAAKEIAMAPQ